MDGLPLLTAVALAAAALDRASKRLAVARLAEGRLYALAGGSGLRRETNTRAGFLLLLPHRRARVVLLAAGACLALVVALGPPLPAAAVAGLGLTLGGAAGNLADRRERGGVIDFIAVGRWPTFNLADAALVCGTAAIAWSLL